MCKICGCDSANPFRVDGIPLRPQGPSLDRSGLPGLQASHDHPHPHPSPSAGDGRRVLTLDAPLRAANDRSAERNRDLFRSAGVLAINVLSSPGSGKTAFLERTLRDLEGQVRAAVVVGDLATDNDARRLRGTGVPAVQITTGDACHLDADMVARAVETLDLRGLDLLFIENVGNLVCPAGFDLGENLRVVLTSVTEGEDKPLKYPVMFRTADVAVLSKTDLAGAVGLDRLLALSNLRRAAPGAILLETSARTGQGMEAWYAYLGSQRRAGA